MKCSWFYLTVMRNQSTTWITLFDIKLLFLCIRKLLLLRRQGWQDCIFEMAFAMVLTDLNSPRIFWPQHDLSGGVLMEDRVIWNVNDFFFNTNCCAIHQVKSESYLYINFPVGTFCSWPEDCMLMTENIFVCSSFGSEGLLQGFHLCQLH